VCSLDTCGGVDIRPGVEAGRVAASARSWLVDDIGCCSLSVREGFKRSFAQQDPKLPVHYTNLSLDRGQPDKITGTTAYAKDELVRSTPSRRPRAIRGGYSDTTAPFTSRRKAESCGCLRPLVAPSCGCRKQQPLRANHNISTLAQ
jgi:hypothetical protein